MIISIFIDFCILISFHKESRNIRDCDGTACGGDSCESGGHCWLDEKLQPHCICPDYAKGDRCEYSETCKLIPCKNNGRCLRSGRCSCPNGWGGFYCEIGEWRRRCAALIESFRSSTSWGKEGSNAGRSNTVF